MKTHRAIGFFLFCLLSFAYVSVANGQDRLADKMDSLQSIVDRTKTQDSLKLLYAEQLSIAQQQGDLKKEALLELKLGASSDYTGVEMERHYAKALAIYAQVNDTLGMTRANYEIANAKQLQNANCLANGGKTGGGEGGVGVRGGGSDGETAWGIRQEQSQEQSLRRRQRL